MKDFFLKYMKDFFLKYKKFLACWDLAGRLS